MDNNTPTLMQSEEKRAPWNDVEPVPMDVCTEVQCMMVKKDVILETYSDDDDLVKLYSDKEYTIVEMLEILKNCTERDLQNCAGNTSKAHALKLLLKSIEGWTMYETIVEKSNG